MGSKKKNKKTTWKLEDSEVYFDENNSNSLIFKGPEREQINFVAIPPGKNRIDLIHFNGVCCFRLEKDFDPCYILDYTGLIVISYQRVRKVLWGTKIIAKTKI